MKVKINGEFKEYTRRNFKCELENNFPSDPKNPFYDYPHDESLFSAKYGIKVFFVPEGYVAVNKWFGAIDKNRSSKKPGPRMMAGLFGFGQSSHVLNKEVQVQDLESENLVTLDNVILTKVNSKVFYRVEDPELAISVPDFREITFGSALGRIVDYVGNHTLEKFLVGDWKRSNLIYDDRGKTIKKIKFGQVEKAGVTIEKLLLTEVPIIEDLRVILAGKAIGKSEKARKIANAEADARQIELESIAVLEAAEKIAGNPLAYELRRMEVYEKFAEGPNNTTIFPYPANININMRREEE